MKLKVISDGTSRGTKIVNAATGEVVENVRAFTFELRTDILPVGTFGSMVKDGILAGRDAVLHLEVYDAGIEIRNGLGQLQPQYVAESLLGDRRIVLED